MADIKMLKNSNSMQLQLIVEWFGFMILNYGFW